MKQVLRVWPQIGKTILFEEIVRGHFPIYNEFTVLFMFQALNTKRNWSDGGYKLLLFSSYWFFCCCWLTNVQSSESFLTVPTHALWLYLLSPRPTLLIVYVLNKWLKGLSTSFTGTEIFRPEHNSFLQYTVVVIVNEKH